MMLRIISVNLSTCQLTSGLSFKQFSHGSSELPVPLSITRLGWSVKIRSMHVGFLFDIFRWYKSLSKCTRKKEGFLFGKDS